MTSSPDLTPYVDLSLNDKDSQELFDAAIALIVSRLTGYVPREGNNEVVLLEGMSLEVSELIYALNRVPSNVAQGIFALQGVVKDIGVQPVVNLTFYSTTGLGFSIPAGTLVRADLGTELDEVIFSTDTELVFSAAQTSGVVSATGDRYTSDANALVAGTDLEMLDSVIYVDSVEFTSYVTPGIDAETDAEYFDRAIQRFTRLSETLVLPSQFVAAALENPAIKRAFALDNYNPAGDPDNNGPVGNDPGYIAVAVYGEGATVPGATKTALDADLEVRAQANLTVNVIDPSINTQAVTVSVVMDAGYTASQVQANVTVALQNYLSTATWNWSTVLRRNELLRVIGNADGVAYVNVLTTPAADVNLTGVAPLVQAGTISVTAT